MAMKSQVVSWMGVSLSLVQGLLKEVQKLGGGDEDVRKLVTPEGDSLLAKFAEMIVGVVRQTFKVVVDYSRNLGQMVSAGKYDWVNENITQENFPIKGDGRQEKEVVLFYFNRIISSEDAIREMDEAGYRPADIAELLALGESQPDLQREFPTAALISVWVNPCGYRFVPCLCGGDAGRGLHLASYSDGWYDFWFFAAVRSI